jgi:hypothetical protein
MFCEVHVGYGVPEVEAITELAKPNEYRKLKNDHGESRWSYRNPRIRMPVNMATPVGPLIIDVWFERSNSNIINSNVVTAKGTDAEIHGLMTAQA